MIFDKIIIGGSMKKVYILLLTLLIVGCESKSINSYKDIDNYYRIYTPYKDRSSVYSISTINSINMEEVETELMDISKIYYDPNKLYYQSGQYLDNEFLKELLMEINDFEEIKVGDKKIKPIYITSIFEQNYLNEDGVLNGISLGITINRYQSYINEYKSISYKIVESDEVYNLVKEKIPIILGKIRDKYELEDVKILVSLFMQSSSSSVYPGSYKYYGITNNNEVKFKSINYKYEDLDNISSVFYNDYIELKDTILKDIKNIYISGYTFLKEDETIKTIINITYNSNNKNSILYLNELINKIISNKFNDTNLSIYIKNNDKIKSMIFKEKSSSKVSIYMVD